MAHSPSALAIHFSNPSMADSPLVCTAKSTIVVVPPQAAARLPVSNVSAAKVPPKGSSMWVCTSMPPGITSFPDASIVRSATRPRSIEPDATMATIFVSWMSTSACMFSVAVTTVPFLMSAEPMTPLRVGRLSPLRNRLPGVRRFPAWPVLRRTRIR